MVGVVDGLVRRDLRRWGGGRESSFVYHHAKRYTHWALTGGFGLYLAWPFACQLFLWQVRYWPVLGPSHERHQQAGTDPGRGGEGRHQCPALLRLPACPAGAVPAFAELQRQGRCHGGGVHAHLRRDGNHDCPGQRPISRFRDSLKKHFLESQDPTRW
ncbi:MAG: DUF4400 domain-containing protein [Rhodoferax sp.]|nr:DUF4400 domain-containing protein [Rhodoferax sp.]